MRKCVLLGVAGVCQILSVVGGASADIAGLNNLSGWKYNQPDSGTPADLPDPNTIHLTTGNGQRRSIFYNTRQDITQFTASFTYRVSNMNPSLVWQGITLCIQNDSKGAAAVGGSGGGLGYASTPGNPQSITSSVAVALFGDSGPARTYNGLWKSGVQGSGNQRTDPANLYAFRDLNVTVTYTNPIITVAIDDPMIGNGVDFTRNYIVGDLADTVGDSKAFIGFTAATGDNFGNGGANQYLSNFTYTVPAPGVVAVAVMASAAMARRRR